MLDKDQLRGMIHEVLWYLNDEIPYSEAALELLMLTAATESRLGTYVMQIQGPARGIFQMEPATEKDIWERFIEFKPRLKAMLCGLRMKAPSGLPDNIYNLAYQIAMARVYYWRRPEPLPQVQIGIDGKLTPAAVHEMAQYWKKHYNTHLGAGTPQKAAENYNFYVQKGIES